MAEAVTAGTLAALPGLAHGFFTRRGGVSGGGFAALNCSLSGRDDPDAVRENRRRAADALGLPGTALVGLTQVHGDAVAVLDEPWPEDARPQADAVVTRRPGLALGIVTADCAPVLFADTAAGVIGAAHAGWRGAVAGVLEATVDAMVAIGARRGRIVAAIGPCIRQPSYEVAADLRRAVLAHATIDARFFAPGARPDRWQFDLAGYCAARLLAVGVAPEVTSHDTLADEARFFSHRRNTLAKGGPIGHQLSAIALGA
ncbi:peptidoglycan editing factor PgeF [Roseomonas rosulenta]|uniref:peptidoglycan editing factor PgeF n=1 Tax=Roseomonas rosulenta TaxID=2748667 RepID=UPI0018DF31C2|nr:peptidoglycan editing factor PgeF [Roseomonas rosulenta]